MRTIAKTEAFTGCQNISTKTVNVNVNLTQQDSSSGDKLTNCKTDNNRPMKNKQTNQPTKTTTLENERKKQTDLSLWLFRLHFQIGLLRELGVNTSVLWSVYISNV